jgi:hypothetical protein
VAERRADRSVVPPDPAPGVEQQVVGRPDEQGRVVVLGEPGGLRRGALRTEDHQIGGGEVGHDLGHQRLGDVDPPCHGRAAGRPDERADDPRRERPVQYHPVVGQRRLQHQLAALLTDGGEPGQPDRRVVVQFRQFEPRVRRDRGDGEQRRRRLTQPERTDDAPRQPAEQVVQLPEVEVGDVGERDRSERHAPDDVLDGGRRPFDVHVAPPRQDGETAVLAHLDRHVVTERPQREAQLGRWSAGVGLQLSLLGCACGGENVHAHTNRGRGLRLSYGVGWSSLPSLTGTS